MTAHKEYELTPQELKNLRIDALRQEAASVMSALDSRLSSITTCVSIGAAIAAAGIIAGVTSRPVLCFVPFVIALPITYAMQISADCTGLATYRSWIEAELLRLTGNPLVFFENKVNAARAEGNKGYHALIAGYLVLFIALSGVALHTGWELRLGHLGGLWLLGSIISIITSLTLFVFEVWDNITVGNKTLDFLLDKKKPTILRSQPR